MSRKKSLAVLAAAPVLAVYACEGPTVPELRYSLNHDFMVKENSLLTEDFEAQSHLDGGLEFLFGTPQHPSYLVLEEWADEEFDPNYWGYDNLSDEEFEAMRASNREAFADQLARIEASEFDQVEPPRYCDDLWADWLAHVEAMPDDGGTSDPDAPDGDTGFTWRENAVELFESYYPSLSNTAEFYRQQCFHCHGAEGGGDGSTGPFLDPPPRDYRLGVFKYTALKDKARPRHQDLFNILTEGVYTTAMPSFRRFSDARLHALVDYVRLLAVRGETEVLMIRDFANDEAVLFDRLKENYQLVVDRWREAGEKLIAFEGEVPRSTPERVAAGRQLYMSETGANCVKCHGDGGRGDGPSVNEPENSVDDWGNQISPRDLTRGVFRFGRRPIDLYRRIYAGINGTPMPEHFGMQITEADGTQRPLEEDDVWNLVFFVRSLSSHPKTPFPGGSGNQAGTADSGH